MREDVPRDLVTGEAHVWLLGPIEDSANRWEDVLSPEERERALRFRFERDRRRWTTTRGVLRHALARYGGGKDPRALRFARGPGGKPYLISDPSGARSDLRFNVSHTDGQVLLAFARGQEVGVDVERVRMADPSLTDLYDGCLTPTEASVLRSAPLNQRPRLFLRYWVCKEVLLKASGAGIQGPLSTVPLPPEIVSGDSDTGSIAGISLRLLGSADTGEGFVAALAVVGNAVALRWFAVPWQDEIADPANAR